MLAFRQVRRLVSRVNIEPLGDSALLITLGTQIDAPTCARVRTIARQIEAAHLPWVVELVPAYASVAVFFDPAAGNRRDELEQVLSAAPGLEDTTVPRLIEIPVRYGGENGPDLEKVAARIGLSSEEVVRRHSSAEYVVGCIGFAPGFPYLVGLPPELAVPRRAQPRRAVPAGSVAIGGAQTGIYPQRSPGGWHIIGWTPLELFSPASDPPALLQAGDHVRFVSAP